MTTATGNFYYYKRRVCVRVCVCVCVCVSVCTVQCTYFGLFGGDLTVTLGETARVAHRVADGRGRDADSGRGHDRGDRGPRDDGDDPDVS